MAMEGRSAMSVEHATGSKGSRCESMRPRIDASAETAYLLSELGSHLPNQPSYHTLYRYATKGMPHRDDRSRMVVLETIEIGRRLHSTIEAYYRMVAEANRR